MQFRAEFLNYRIDFDRRDLPDAVSKRGRGVRTCARAENERVLELILFYRPSKKKGFRIKGS